MTFNLLLMAADKKVEMNVDAYCRAVRRVNSNFGITDLRACCSQWRIGTVSLNISPKIDLGRRLICDRQVSLNFQAAYVDQIMI